MSRVYDVAFRNAVTGGIKHVEGYGNTHKVAKRSALANLQRALAGLKGEDVRNYVHHSIKFKAQR